MITTITYKVLKTSLKIRYNRLYSKSAIRQQFKLSSPTWSLLELRIQSSQGNTIDEKTIDYLCDLAKIDLNSSSVSKAEVIQDVNTILNCAKSLQVLFCNQ